MRAVVVAIVRVFCAVSMLGLLACGDDDDGQAGGTAAPLSDGGYPMVPCPDDTPEFRIGLQAEGEDGAVVARLVDADRIPPRQYQNAWTVEFLTPDGTAIDDADLVMARPYM